MLHDESNGSFPKTLHIRNEVGGMIWQIYHVETLDEAQKLASNATRNGFMSCILVNYTGEEQTWPDWRDNAPGIVGK
jgi:hypothetical protein